MNHRIIILLGQRVRSGTNFVGTTLAQHPEVNTVPPSVSRGEFNLFMDRSIITKVFDRVVRTSFSSGITREDEGLFLQQYANAWLELLKAKHRIDEKQVLFIKSPVIENWDLWQKAFPTARIALLCRDGRDNVISSVVAGNDKRRWHSKKITLVKRINYYSGRSFISHAKDWRKTASILNAIPESENIKKFRYEALNNSAPALEELLGFYKLSVSQEILEKCINAPVVGSSWGVKEKDQAKPNWTPDFDKKRYQFTNKWQKWGPVKRGVFDFLAKKEMAALGYY